MTVKINQTETLSAYLLVNFIINNSFYTRVLHLTFFVQVVLLCKQMIERGN